MMKHYYAERRLLIKPTLAGKLVARRWRFAGLKITSMIDNNANFSTFEFVKMKFLVRGVYRGVTLKNRDRDFYLAT